MALKKWAYLYLSPGFSPEKHTTVIASEYCEFITVGFDFCAKQDAIGVAKKLVAEGVQMIELCGGFGPLWIAKVSEAISGAVPVGSTAYGPEARRPMLEILA